MAAEEHIPVYTTLQDLYGGLGTSLDHALRWNNLAEEFEKRFGREPAYIARAPGRVNLIGEHIDYALFGVLPMAVERDILIACAPRPVVASPDAEVQHAPGGVIAENLHSKYTRQMFAPEVKKKYEQTEVGEDQVHVEGWHLDINTKELRWESYVKAGYYGVLSHYFPSASANAVESGKHPVPVDLLVTGSVPAGSGLSSSAAMVVASTLAFLAVNGKLSDSATAATDHQLSKGELVKMSMENEKRVGVNSGGMDQAASVMSDSSSALYITFYPTLKAAPVRLPPGAVFVCANSLVVSDKAVTAKSRYNLRVVETLVGARILARALGIQVGEKEKITYREVVGRFAGEKHREELDAAVLMQLLTRMGDEEIDVLKPKGLTGSLDEQLGVTMDEMIEMSGLSKEVFNEVYLSWVEVEANHFQLYKRAKHVFGEAFRVLQFRQVCIEAMGGSGIDDAAEQEIGTLMNDSQDSCNELFECSCPELNELTRLALESGAYGSRLTGAGWGGCTVSLVPGEQVGRFIKRIRDSYGPYKDLESDALSEVIFATRPSSGACVYKFE
ncbi:Galactokinase [Crucibulum laeve]|uniref:Galactokinase n=1 Tax=Crucibulum laeve TaxID=68775 RepID=A0A5C3LVU0_9AGAR|nr:Galactokinase [Crucibulum laeve]